MKKMVLRLIKLIAGLIFVTVLAACGGGGGAGGGPPPASGSPEPTESSNWGSMEWDKDVWG